ncbi:unnamed protein product, partial [Rotaria sordida]
HNAKIFTTYGIHPKYLPSNRKRVLQELENIFKNEFDLNTTKVAIGECGLDDTSKSSFDRQLSIFKFQLKLAAELQLPVVLHGRGTNSFEAMLHELKLHLNDMHRIHWHCVNPRSDLNVISNFLNHFQNSFIGLNGSIIIEHDLESQKLFNNWLLAQQNVLDQIIIETDFSFLRPPTLETNQYNPVSGISTTAQSIVNILRMKNLNATKIIDRWNNNIRRIHGID